MRFELTSGATIDVVSPAELEAALAAAEARALEREPVPIREYAAKLTSAAGELAFDVYRVPRGYRFTLHRVIVTLDGYSPANAYTNAALQVLLERGGELHAFADPAQLPTQLVRDGQHQAVHYRNGEAVTVHVIGGPGATRVGVALGGYLRKGAP